MIVIGYSADQFGKAALEHGIAEAKLRDTNLLVINATRGFVGTRALRGREVHDLEALLEECGVEFELAQPVGVDAAAELLTAMDRASRAPGRRYPAPQPGGQALARQRRAEVLLECPKPVLAVKPKEL